jgi:hypothetical protein
MRSALSILLLCAVAVCGCAGKKKSAPPTGAAAKAGGAPVWASMAATNQPVTITPETASAGRVVLVDPAIRCVVLNFPLGKMAAPEERLSLYRRGQKVGEIRVTGPQREDNTVADLLAGEAQVGDEARGQ